MKNKKYRTILLPVSKGILDTSMCTSSDIDVLEKNLVVYIYFCKTHIYIGQTIGFIKRHKEHLKETDFDYQIFDRIIILFGQYIDRNAQEDLEKQLITYLTVDNYELRNGKGRKIHNAKNRRQIVDYTTRTEVFSEVLIPFWENDLKELGLVHETNLDTLRQSILFKYSPFTDLLIEQINIIDTVLSGAGNYLIRGCAGTGKTVVLTNLVARLFEKRNKNVKIGVVVKSNWRNSAKKIFNAYSIGTNVEIGSAYQIIKNKKKYDIIIVDEAHRLRWNYSKQIKFNVDIFDPAYPKKNELYLLGKKTKQLVLLYDDLQSVRPADIPYLDFQNYIKTNKFELFDLTVQFRIRLYDPDSTYTADDYINGIKDLLQFEYVPYDKKVFQNTSPDAYFGMVNSISELFDYINRCQQYKPTSQNRVLSGCSRKWISKGMKTKKRLHLWPNTFDWHEGSNHWHWNSTYENWIAREGSVEEIGCIHAIQGMDLDYAGVVIGKDISYKDGKIIGVKENYFDEYGIPVAKGYNPDELTSFIKRIYYVLLTRGINGIRIYIEDEALREYFLKKTGLQ